MRISDWSSDVCSSDLTKNIVQFMGLESADAGMAPTFWQFQQYPAEFRHKISVIHDGIDTKVCVPNPDASIAIKTPAGALTTLLQGDEIVTFVLRNLEPYRGFPQFMPPADILQIGRAPVRDRVCQSV